MRRGRYRSPSGPSWVSACGSSVPAQFAGNPVLRSVANAGRWLRWLACSLLPDLYEAKRNDPGCRWAEASVFFYFWSAAEAFVLNEWVHFLQNRGDEISHLSLHFDGVLLTAQSIQTEQDVEDLCKA